jgi:hypothetical protein
MDAIRIGSTRPTRREMSEGTRREDLRATVDSVAADVEELASVENAKLGFDPAGAEVRELSHEAEQLGNRIHQKTVAEVELSEATKADEDRRPN